MPVILKEIQSGILSLEAKDYLGVPCPTCPPETSTTGTSCIAQFQPVANPSVEEEPVD